MLLRITVETNEDDVGCTVTASPGGRLWDVRFHAEGHSYLIGQQESIHDAIGLALAEVI